jgi:hypothetical protein
VRTGLAALLVTAILAAGCASERRQGEEVSTGGLDSPQLVFTRSDGSHIRFPGKVLVWCGPWDDMVAVQTIHVAAIGGIREGQVVSYWHLWTVAGDVRRGARFATPIGFEYAHPSGAQLFVADTATGNELNSEGEDSQGRIRFAEGSCKIGAPVSFHLEGLIDSEFGDAQPIRVPGSFSGLVGEAPPVF